MLRESELISQLVVDRTRNRIDRMLPDVAGADPGAAVAYLLGLGTIVLAALFLVD